MMPCQTAEVFFGSLKVVWDGIFDGNYSSSLNTVLISTASICIHSGRRSSGQLTWSRNSMAELSSTMNLIDYIRCVTR